MSNKSNKKGRPTIRDVAKLAQVAPITVSRVVNNSGYIGLETRRRVEKAIEQLNYIPNSLSQSLRYQKTDMITLLVSDVTNPFWTTITRGVEDVCNANGLNVILCNTDEKSEKLEDYVRILLQRQMDGFIIAPTSDDAEIIQLIEDNNVPIVLVDRMLSNVQTSAVYSDSETGAYLLTQHLLELGHREFGMISGSQLQSTSVQRTTGFRRALEDHGISMDTVPILHGQVTQQSGYEMTMELYRTRENLPTALLAANNFIAFGAQKAFSELGVVIPRDISLAAFDDLPFQIFPTPFLTTAAQDPYRLGQEAANLLVKQIKADEKCPPEQIVLPVQIIIRGSTAPPYSAD